MSSRISNKDIASSVIKATRTGDITKLRRIFSEHPNDKKMLANVKGRYVEVFHTSDKIIETEYYFTPIVFAIDAWVHEHVKLRENAQIVECIVFLLKNGADLKETVTIDGTEVKCKEFLEDRYNYYIEMIREKYKNLI